MAEFVPSRCVPSRARQKGGSVLYYVGIMNLYAHVVGLLRLYRSLSVYILIYHVCIYSVVSQARRINYKFNKYCTYKYIKRLCQTSTVQCHVSHYITRVYIVLTIVLIRNIHLGFTTGIIFLNEDLYNFLGTPRIWLKYALINMLYTHVCLYIIKYSDIIYD